VTDPVAVTSESYDQIVSSYDEIAGQPSPTMEAFRAQFTARVQGRVADLGCGPGRDLERFTAQGLDVVGVDRSVGMLALARTRGVVVCGDLRLPPLRPGSFDGVWSSASLLHVPREDVPATLQAWRALLTAGGMLGLSTSIGGGEGWERVPYATPKPTPEPLDRWFVHHDQDELLVLLASAGFEVLSAERNTTKREWLRVLAQAG
jgi:SAM-dependent methyltransferase